MNKSKLRLTISLIVVLLVILLTSTFAWFTGLVHPDLDSTLTAGSYTEVFLDSADIELDSEKNPIYHGQKGYDENNQKYENADAPYYSKFDIKYKALSNNNLKVKYTTNYCVIAVTSFFEWDCKTSIKNIFGESDATIDSQLSKYIGEKNISSDTKGRVYYKFNKETLKFEKFIENQQFDKYTAPADSADKEGYVVLEGNSKDSSAKVTHIVIKKQFVSKYFTIVYSKLTTNDEGVTDQNIPPINMDENGYLYLYKSKGEIIEKANDIASSKKLNGTRFSIGYYGSKTVIEDEKNVIKYTTFAFSNDVFRGATFSFSIAAEGVDHYEDEIIS